MDRAPDRATAQPQQTLRPRRPSSCVTTQNTQSQGTTSSYSKTQRRPKNGPAITTRVLENVLKKMSSVGTQTEVVVRPTQPKTKTVETQTEEIEMQQELFSNAEKSIRAVYLTETESFSGPPLVLEPTVQKKKKNRKKSQRT